MGNFRAANEAMENYRKSVADANRAKAESDRADALLAGRAAAANRMPAKGAGQAPANVQLRDSIAAEYISKGMSPVAANARATRELLAAQGTKAVTSNITSDIIPGGPKAQLGEAGIGEKVSAAVTNGLDKFKKDASIGIVKTPDTIAYKAAIKAGDMAKANAILKKVENDIRAGFSTNAAPVAAPPTPANQRGNLSAPRTSVALPPGFVPD
jgi:hypothetical protein